MELCRALRRGMTIGNAPRRREAADDVKPVTAGKATARNGRMVFPQAAVIVYRDPGVTAGDDGGVDGESAA